MPESKKFMLILVGRSKEILLNILKKVEAKIINLEIQEYEKIYRLICYGEFKRYIFPVIHPSLIEKGVTIYEYHLTKMYILKTYSFKELQNSDIRYIVDILYQTGPLSLRDAMEVLFKKRIFRLDEDRISQLLEYKGSILYESIIDRFLENYLDVNIGSFLNIDTKSAIEREITILLRNIRDFYKEFYKLQNLTINQFLSLLSK